MDEVDELAQEVAADILYSYSNLFFPVYKVFFLLWYPCF